MSRQLPQSVARRVVGEVLAGTDVAPFEVFSRTHARRVSWLRQEAMVRLRAITDEGGKPLYSLPEIGRAFDRDHTTVMHALRETAKRIHKQVEIGGQTPVWGNAAIQRLPEAADY